MLRIVQLYALRQVVRSKLHGLELGSVLRQMLCLGQLLVAQKQERLHWSAQASDATAPRDCLVVVVAVAEAAVVAEGESVFMIGPNILENTSYLRR